MGENSKKCDSLVSKNISKNLLQLQKKSGKSRKKICEDLKISYYTWGDWLSRRSMPSIETIGQIASYFGVPVSVIIEDSETSTAPVALPIWNACDAITYKGMGGFFSDGNGRAYISYSDMGSEKLIAYVVDVGAMPPVISKGDIAIVRLCDTVTDNHIGLFIIGYSNVCCRYIQKMDNVTVLYGTENPTIITNNEPNLDLVGEITEVRKRCT